MSVLGFLFVNLVNLKHERSRLTWDQHLNNHSFVKMTVFILPLIFFWSPIVSLRGEYDLDGYCNQRPDAYPPQKSLNAQELTEIEQAINVLSHYNKVLRDKK
mmetsp:Transcript_5615/g.9677  ORF Transcript_5615/g.9677 Transcript_5615/m.9677 type:complete len:102 (-) Transcript_5615:746-1051(-)